MKAEQTPDFSGELRKHLVKVPETIYLCRGMRIFGRRIKSIIFTTDLAIIRNSNADAVLAVYPFTPQPVITHSLMLAADTPVFCGVGGGTTTGQRVVELSKHAEFQGAMGVVVNSPTENETIRAIKQAIDIPIVATVVDESTDIEARLAAGVSILNVSAAARTPQVVAHIRAQYPDVAILATGGPDDKSIRDTIEAGANSITWTPPSAANLFKGLMTKYRQGLPRAG